MSKFAEILKKVYSHNDQPIGFRKPSADRGIPSILLVAEITSLPLKKTKEIITAGVAGLVVNGAVVDESSLKETSQMAGNIPLGIMITDGDKVSKIATEAGLDFMAIGLTAGPALLAQEGMGKLLVISESILPGMIKAINDISMEIDGVIIDYQDHKLDMEFILTCHMFSDMLNKPLLVKLYKRNIEDAELKALSSAGVRGLLLPKEITLTGIKILQKSIASLPAVSKRRKSEAPLIPGFGVSSKEVEEIEEPEEE